MAEFVASYPWALPILGLLIGVALGVVGAQMFERKKTGGRTVEDVQNEMNEYKEEVGKHFAMTSELFRDMTEKYRDVYNHLASGSQALCEDEIEHARLEFAEAKTIAADRAPDESAHPANNSAAVESSVEATPEVVDATADVSQNDVSNRSDPPLKS